MSSEALKNCPFCGGEARIEYASSTSVECSGCSAAMDGLFSTPEEAIAAWNRRPTPEPGEVASLVSEAATRLSTLSAEVERLTRERDALREALKPSGETKAAYIGEFTIAVERFVNDDEEPDDETEGAHDPYEHITVPWTTIKEIMAAISERALSNHEVGK